MTVEQYRPQEPGAEVATRPADPTGGRLIAWAQAASAAQQLGEALAVTRFVPEHFQDRPDDCAAAIMYGDEIGLSPGMALQSIYVTKGKPSLYARAMAALVLARGHEIWTETISPQRAIVCGQRKGSSHVERVEWTTAKAQRAGYTRNPRYQADPEGMLYARAVGDVARRVAPDALAGLAFNVEELELGATPATGEPAPTSTAVASDGERRTAQRASARPAAPEPPLDADKLAQQGQPEKPEGGDKPEPSEKTLRKMGVLMREAGVTVGKDREDDRRAALEWAGRVVGREIESRKDLTPAEASRVIDALEREKTAAAGDNPGFGGDQPPTEPAAPADDDDKPGGTS